LLLVASVGAIEVAAGAGAAGGSEGLAVPQATIARSHEHASDIPRTMRAMLHKHRRGGKVRTPPKLAPEPAGDDSPTKGSLTDKTRSVRVESLAPKRETLEDIFAREVR